jgi:hypothetical protein
MIALNNLVEDSIITKLLNEIVYIRLEHHIVNRAIEDGDWHIDVLHRELRRYLLSINSHVRVFTVVIFAEMTTICHTLAIVNSCAVACTTWEIREHNFASIHIVDFRDQEFRRFL